MSKPPDLIVPLICKCEPIGDGTQVQVTVDITAPTEFGKYLWEKIHDAIRKACEDENVPIEESSTRFSN